MCNTAAVHSISNVLFQCSSAKGHEQVTSIAPAIIDCSFEQVTTKPFRMLPVGLEPQAPCAMWQTAHNQTSRHRYFDRPTNADSHSPAGVYVVITAWSAKLQLHDTAATAANLKHTTTGGPAVPVS